ncbi:MAG TPA: VOC family protein [Gammaproteobacteria bacterium]|jgi:predicted lactoylglutathione lyase|nr:VOC family protein [Gammaproteobacteria bacterium]HIO18607.1 VOC family protein [Gammaproteobacteria bacterium]|tara:strand:- start:596 stop:964 length:369 start_codon:yes stop_codon:yes gene_type:complete
MKGYVTLGTNDLEKSAQFYESLFECLGFARQREVPGRAVYFGPGNDVQLVVITPADGQPATSGNGTMVALNVDSQEQVQRLHARAIELGGTDEGAPGPRGGETFYGAYFRDPDGNKIAFYLR